MCLIITLPGGIQNNVVLCLRPVVEVTPEAGSPEGISRLACILVQETLFIVKQGIYNVRVECGIFF